MSEIRERILNTKTTRSEIFESAQWGVKIKVKGMSYAKRTEMLKECAVSADRVDMAKMVPWAIIETFHDPLNDQPIFTNADRDAIASQSPEAIEEARVVIWRVIGLSVEEVEKK